MVLPSHWTSVHNNMQKTLQVLCGIRIGVAAKLLKERKSRWGRKEWEADHIPRCALPAEHCVGVRSCAWWVWSTCIVSRSERWTHGNRTAWSVLLLVLLFIRQETHDQRATAWVTLSPFYKRTTHTHSREHRRNSHSHLEVLCLGVQCTIELCSFPAVETRS